MDLRVQPNCGPHAKHEIIAVGSATPNALGHFGIEFAMQNALAATKKSLRAGVFWETESAAAREHKVHPPNAPVVRICQAQRKSSRSNQIYCDSRERAHRNLQ